MLHTFQIVPVTNTLIELINVQSVEKVLFCQVINMLVFPPFINAW